MTAQLGNRIAWLLVGALSGAGVYATLNHDMHRESVARLVTAREVPTRAASGSPARTPPLTPAGGAQSTGPDLEDFFVALAHVESGGDDTAVGDGGASLGRYQIGLAYWRDAWGLDDEPVTDAMRERYRREVTDPGTARRTMLAYWRRYCPAALEAGDWATLARVHNGGPRGATKQATEAYAAKVAAKLER